MGDKLVESKILIIEDDRTQRLLLRKVFEDLKFKNIEEAIDGKEGWEKTKRMKPDLVILDINMPVMDGFEYCQLAKNFKETKNITVLVQTGLDDLQNKEKIFKVGATDYITKPIDFSEIIARSLIHLRNTLNLKELNEYNLRVKEELAAARNLVELSLPDQKFITKVKNKYNIDIAAKLESTQEMGGDFWGIEPLDENRLSIYSIDVAGHGLESALSALRIHTLIHANYEQVHEPDLMLKLLNEKLVELFPTGLFATMFYGIIDKKQDTLAYSVASVPNPIIIQAGGENKSNKVNGRKPSIFSGQGYPLGLIKNAVFTTKCIKFAKDDILILYSDAITEAIMKNTEQMFGQHRLLELVKDSIGKQCEFSADKTLDLMLSNFHKQCGNKLDDDLTLNIYHRLN